MRFQYDQNENSGFGQFQSPQGQQQFSRMLSRGGGAPFQGFNRKPTNNIMPGPPQSYGPTGRTEGYIPPGPPQGPQGPGGFESTFKGDPFQVRPGGPGYSITRPERQDQRNPWKGDPFQSRPDGRVPRPQDITPPGDPRGGLGFGLGPEIPGNSGYGIPPGLGQFGPRGYFNGGPSNRILPQESPISPIGPVDQGYGSNMGNSGMFNWRF